MTMIAFLHFLGILFGVAAIGCAVAAVINMLTSISFPDSMADDVWRPYAKKTYIFLGLTLLFMVVGSLLSLI